jgi:alcohol dehydrogenase (cytochrome c)
MVTCARGFIIAVAIVVMGAAAVAQLKTIRPVTDEVLQNPPPADWLHWRRTYDGWGYSPLDQINRQTVGQLQLAWSWAMQPGNQQTTPLVYDGVMYLANPGSTVQALNAATGDLLWEYPANFPRKRVRNMRSGRCAG